VSIPKKRRPTVAQTCDSVVEWASAFDQEAREHNNPSVNRIGAIAWLEDVVPQPEGVS
jgi:hypothetical protein